MWLLWRLGQMVAIDCEQALGRGAVRVCAALLTLQRKLPLPVVVRVWVLAGARAALKASRQWRESAERRLDDVGAPK